MIKRVLFVTMLLLASSLPAFCASPRVWVVAIGVSKYTQALNALPKAAQGAQRFAEALEAGRPGSTDVTLLTTDSDDDASQPMKANIIRSMNQLAQNVKPSDLAIFYFCGHGIELNGQQYLLTKEADLTTGEGIAASTVSLGWVRKKMEALPCNGRLVILDACRETPASLKRTGGVGAPSPMTKDFLTSGGGWQAQPGKVSATLFGCDQGEQVHYGKNGSFFTEALVDGLSGGAVDKTGQVTLGSLAEYVRKRVPEAVHREFGKDAEQMPVLRGTGKSIVLRPSAGYIACFALAGEYGDVFGEAIQTRLAESGKVNLVERSSLASAMKELKMQNSGLTESETVQKLGKMINAKYVLAGSSRKGPNGKLAVTVRLVAVSSGQNVPGAAASADVDPANWRPDISAMADDLLGRMEGTVLTGATFKPAVGSSRTSEIPDTAVQWPVENGGNGHYYEVVVMANLVTWREARGLATEAGGYLATITSAAENRFVHDLALANEKAWQQQGTWMGIWEWGPWLGGFQPKGSREPDGGWKWVTGEPFTYMNWVDYAFNEENVWPVLNTIAFRHPKDTKAGSWATDTTDSTFCHSSYAVEYDPTGKTADTKVAVANTSQVTPTGQGATNPKDGAEMVLVPAGEFLMGTADTDGEAGADEKPQHKVYLDAYYIYRTPLTVAQYRKFCQATGEPMPREPSWGWKEDHPIVNVTWDQAARYARWAGAHLPTEAQWEKAARGTDGRTYPWGNTWGEGLAQCSRSVVADAGSTAAVGSFPAGASPYGAFDMIGNVWEWCADIYDAAYYSRSPGRNPTGPTNGDLRLLRGGSWRDNNLYFLRTAVRTGLSTGDAHDNRGFRCAVPK